MNDINPELYGYVNEKILPLYFDNIGGHDVNHVLSVIERSFEIIREFNLCVDPNIIFVAAVYHDISYKENPDLHEELSAQFFLKDKYIKKFFNEDEIQLIFEAIIDHRASLEYEARNIYGKIVSSADREISVENMLERSLRFQKDKHDKENPTLEQIIEYSFKKLSSKFGKDGYAKMYFPDNKYKQYLQAMQELLGNKNEFIEREKLLAKQIKLLP